MSDDDTRARMARLAKEREEAMGGSPAADAAAPQPSGEDAELQARMARLAKEREEEFSIEDTTPRENEAMLEARRIAEEQQNELKSNEYQFWTPERLASAFGGTAGLLLGNPLKGDPGSIMAQLAERMMGAPSGSIRDIYGVQNPMDPMSISRQIAEQRVAPLQEGALPTTVTSEPDLTPGEKWGSKTGYGKGAGTVNEASSAYQRSVSKGKSSSKMDKLFGIRMPGEPAGLFDRMLFRKQQAEAAQAAAAQAEQNRPIVEEAQRQEFERAQQERNRIVDQIDQSQRRAKTLYDVGTGTVGRAVNVLSGAMGARDVYSGLNSMFPVDAETNNRTYKPNSVNVPLTAGGAAALYALRNPTVGLPLAGAAQIYGAGRDISNEGKVTPETGTRGLGGLGTMIMARHPITGIMMQMPAAWNAMYELSKENPDWFKAATGVDAFSSSKVDPKTLLPKRQ
jgi:hypothetical protein